MVLMIFMSRFVSVQNNSLQKNKEWFGESSEVIRDLYVIFNLHRTFSGLVNLKVDG